MKMFLLEIVTIELQHDQLMVYLTNLYYKLTLVGALHKDGRHAFKSPLESQRSAKVPPWLDRQVNAECRTKNEECSWAASRQDFLYWTRFQSEPIIYYDLGLDVQVRRAPRAIVEHTTATF